MLGNFDKAVTFTYVDEAGNDDDPVDSGGRTSDGITQREFNAWCALNNTPIQDIWAVPWETKKQIYKIQYWDPYCDKLPGGVDYLFFDTFVNSGLHEAALILQRTVGVVADGHIGVVTLGAAAKIDNLGDFVQRFCDDHQHVYSLIIQAHPKYVKFINGWTNRISHERVNAMKFTLT
jgi:lysozyme family protein